MITDLKINAERKRFYYEKGYWTEKSIGDVWADRIASHPERTYVTDDQGSSYTYGEVDDRAGRLAAWLIEEGIEPGDVVTFQLPIWAEFCIVYVACLKCGAVMHPVPPNFNDEDLVYNMNKVGSRAFICPTAFHRCDFVKQAYAVKDRIPTLASIAFVDKQAPAPEGAATTPPSACPTSAWASASARSPCPPTSAAPSWPTSRATLTGSMCRSACGPSASSTSTPSPRRPPAR